MDDLKSDINSLRSALIATMNETNSRTESLRSEINNLRSKMNNRINEFDKKLDNRFLWIFRI
jgi:5S rRNA maturation endonuclease (ribonuclease M5)